MSEFTATYSPDDNKLRLYAAGRLPEELYKRVRSHGFIWAAKQDLFVAPAWTPDREDFLIELCGEIGDEDTSLADRAEQRAERFDEYREHRIEDANRAQDAVSAIADNIPLGQPILVGHHSERHARKDAEKIENGMRRTLKMWETAKYWQSRAAGAIRHAKYKERPDVRARRIKGLESDRRKQEKRIKEGEIFLTLWNKDRDQIEAGVMVLTLERAKAIAGRMGYDSHCFTLEKYPRLTPEASKYEGAMSIYSALDGIITPEQARTMAVRRYTSSIAWAKRWLEHINNRLTYEKAMLEEAGASELIAPKARPKQLPLCNYRVPAGLDIENQYHRGEMIHYPQIEMTQAEYAKIHTDYKGTRVVGRSHRIRTAMQRHSLYCVFLTDSKVHTVPTDGPAPEPKTRAPRTRTTERTPDPIQERIDTMRDAVKAGVQVVSAPQLFPTPKDIAEQVAELADIQPGMRVLEPSAGTGMLLGAMGGRMFGNAEPRRPGEFGDRTGEVVAVEINPKLADRLRHEFPLTDVRAADFLECNGDLGTFDRIVMNPPFERGSDIKHILHAQTMLNPGGVLVAICANGPRQREQLQPIAAEWIDLPADSFKQAGTGVNTAIVVIR